MSLEPLTGRDLAVQPKKIQHTAQVITGDREAITVARALAERFADSAAQRDASRTLPHQELAELAASGLLGISVPRLYGGAQVSAVTTAEVFRLLATADPNIAQIPQSHFTFLHVLDRQGTPEQQRLIYGEVLAGKLLGNAQAEKGTRHAQEIRTRLTEHAGGGYVLNGIKNYSTGALFADWIPVTAKNPEDQVVVVFLPAGTPGVSIVDDWDGMGQRTTASGTVKLDNVRVPAELVAPHHLTFDGPQLHGARAQLLHAAIDVGIARGALAEAGAFVRNYSRPWAESGVEWAAEDPLTIQRFGELEIRVRAAEALLSRAAKAVDEAGVNLTEETASAASIAVATAKAFADPVAVEVSAALFEVAGTRSALDSLNLDRYWRNARTHTLHDPVRWKVQHIGRYALNGTPPPRHGSI
ncbi:SfnB family sulfur acquisition oxidoreductase [Pseudonocardiaceae bacterium YIM PH 21723]|nr:SfnB family sulfur acquisition oxidoreductase [Pseudonocardiaceae bacterium YIM PH 21723]